MARRDLLVVPGHGMRIPGIRMPRPETGRLLSLGFSFGSTPFSTQSSEPLNEPTLYPTSNQTLCSPRPDEGAATTPGRTRSSTACSTAHIRTTSMNIARGHLSPPVNPRTPGCLSPAAADSPAATAQSPVEADTPADSSKPAATCPHAGCHRGRDYPLSPA